MTIGLFYYTWMVGLFILMGSATALACYLVSRRRMFLCCAALFLVYFFDVATVARTDFTHPRNIDSVYHITAPVESITLGALLMGLIWLTYATFMTEPEVKVEWRSALIPAGIFVVGSAGALMIPDPGWREFVFFSMRGIVVIGILSAATWNYLRATTGVEKIRQRRHRWLYVTTWVTVLGTFAWNITFIFLVAPQAHNASALAFLPERNFLENLMYICWVIHVMRFGVRVLRIHFDRPPETVNHLEEDFIESSLVFYSQARGLSKREEEVLGYLMRGKTNAQISTELYLSPSTVKVHVHNILKKSQVANREELVKDFWRSV